MTEQTVKRCAACRQEKPVSEMKTCMHTQMHYYVCDSKCMSDFYNPPKTEKPNYEAAISALQSRLDAAEVHRNDLADRIVDLKTELGAMRQQLAERDALLRDIFCTCNLREMPSEHAIRDISNRIESLLSVSAEPAAQCKRCMGVGTIPGRDRDGSPTEEWCPEGCRDGFDAQYDEPAKGGDGEVQS